MPSGWCSEAMASFPSANFARQWGNPSGLMRWTSPCESRKFWPVWGEGSPVGRWRLQLAVTESTVKLHLSSLLKKLGVATRVQALARAHAMGLT